MSLKESSAFPDKLPDPKLLGPIEVDEMLMSIQHTQGFHYKLMNLEVWALVETLDRLFPGAWGQFMTNRQLAVKQFLQRRDPNCSVKAEDVGEKEEGNPPLAHKGERKKATPPSPLPTGEGRSKKPAVKKKKEEE